MPKLTTVRLLLIFVLPLLLLNLISLTMVRAAGNLPFSAPSALNPAEDSFRSPALFFAPAITATKNYTLQGSNGADILSGGGNDWLRGGQDADDLTGGLGPDRFDFAAGEGGATVSVADIIQDFQNGTDLIGLVGLTFAQLTLDQSQNVVGDASLDTIISITVSGEVLAALDGVTGLIDTNDFVTAP